MHIHILGICGTFMGGVAALAKADGHHVTGSDQNVYPPMSTHLQKMGIEILDGYDAGQLQPAPDHVVVGNALSRGNPAVEAMLNQRIPYSSGPRWLAEHLLSGRHVLAVAGTHGKTTTASMLAWILEDNGHQPGFLIGGIPGNFGVSARSGDSRYFIVEADEYDTAFFDKRAKFVHYAPQTLVMNNLEFDHADIYADMQAIQWQFHQLLRTVPSNARILLNGGDENLKAVIEMGCWTPTETFGLQDAEWTAEFADSGERHIRLTSPDGDSASGKWTLGGRHNLENALAAVAAARSAGVSLADSVDALSRFSGVKRRMERTATVGDIAVFDDFAHHPTAIRRSIEAMTKRYPGQRVIVALEPRSNTMKMGVHNDKLADSLGSADGVFVFRPDNFPAEFDQALNGIGDTLRVFQNYDTLVAELLQELRPGDLMVFMSNGGFGAARQKLTIALQKKHRRNR